MEDHSTGGGETSTMIAHTTTLCATLYVHVTYIWWELVQAPTVEPPKQDTLI